MSALAGVARAALVVVAVAAYQLLAHHAVATPGEHGLGLAMALVPPMAIALAAAARSPRRGWLLPLWALAAAALWAAHTPLALHFEWGLYLEHVSFNLGMALLFGRTLVHGRVPLCSQFASMIHGSLTPAVARYTRQITVAWTAFFVAIAAVSTLMFAAAPIVAWATFANYLALPLVGAMFVAEHVCRRFALRHERRSGMLDAIRAYRQASAQNNAGQVSQKDPVGRASQANRATPGRPNASRTVRPMP
ncbi:hypothetical protein [Paraburkholderia pallida]|uniref:COG4648 family protein n=1 Tax=Paraburkholderia pallida TaxID=2547399 RepID=UPI001E4171AD|nr:hypothetical protein [Paraburkholderia pallida]